MQELRDPGGGSGQPRFLVVPKAPGALIDPEAGSDRAVPDEVDLLIDDLLGPDIAGSPGWTDAILLLAGLALVLAGLFVIHSRAATIVGVVALGLGLILPVRSSWRWLRRRRVEGRRRVALSQGRVLDVGHPLVQELAAAYEDLLAAVAAPGASFAPEAKSAAYLAVSESAFLLDGGIPSTPADEAYIRTRVEAISTLAAAVRDQRPARGEDAERQARLDERTARARAGEELEALGLSSVQDLNELTVLVRKASREPDA